jgi:colanic acid biosynthesis glycosyl transferase WcaI
MMYEPDCVGIAAVATDMCEALAARGHDVTVYTTYPYYPEWKLKAARNPLRIQEETIRGVRVRRHRIYVPSSPSRLVPRVLHEMSFPLSLSRSLFHRKRFDVVMVFCPLLGAVAFTALRKFFRGGPLWLNVQDIPVAAASASGIIRSRLLARGAAQVQRFLFRRAEVWSSISPDMVQQLEGFRKTSTQVHLCPNWLTGSLHEQLRQVSARPRQRGDKPRLLYSGTIGKKQGLLEFCRQLAQCDSDFRFRIRGEGGEAAAVRRWVQSSDDGRFEFDGLLPTPEFIRSIHEADWFVVPQKSSAGCSFFPSKLIPSIFAGTPILAISDNHGPLFHEVSENGLGLVVPWSRVHRLTEELDVFRQLPERYHKLRANCLQRAQSFDREVAMDHFEVLLQGLHAQRSEVAGKSLLPGLDRSRATTT